MWLGRSMDAPYDRKRFINAEKEMSKLVEE
jgi:hypothetical protein